MTGVEVTYELETVSGISSNVFGHSRNTDTRVDPDPPRANIESQVVRGLNLSLHAYLHP